MDETISQRFRRLSSAFAAKVEAVPPDRWSAPSPCEGWTARDVVRHVTETPAMFFGFVGREFTPVPAVDDDPAASFSASSAQVQAALDDPEVAEAEFEGFFGKQTFAQAVDRFLNFDLLVHGWDLARAAGLDDRMDPGDVRRLDEAAKGFGDAMRGPQAFGPAIEPPPGADDQARVLAFLGRQP